MTFDEILAISRFLNTLRERVWEMQTAPWCRGLRGFKLIFWNGVDVTVDPPPTVEFVIYADRVASLSPSVAEGLTGVMASVNADLDRPIDGVPTEAFVALMRELVNIASATTGSEPLMGRAVGPTACVCFIMTESDGPTVELFLAEGGEDPSNPTGLHIKVQESNVLFALMGAMVQARILKEEEPWYKQLWHWLFPLWGE
jgi:hypothetical protein